MLGLGLRLGLADLLRQLLSWVGLSNAAEFLKNAESEPRLPQQGERRIVTELAYGQNGVCVLVDLARGGPRHLLAQLIDDHRRDLWGPAAAIFEAASIIQTLHRGVYAGRVGDAGAGRVA